jgi:hypothetical protein
LTVCSNLTSDPDRTEDTVTTRFKVHNGFYPLFEDFETYEGRAFPPSLWRASNPDNDCFTWLPGHCVGSNGQRTTAMFVNLYAYSNTGRRDELYSPIIDLTSAPATVALTFDVRLSALQYFLHRWAAGRNLHRLRGHLEQHHL